MASVFTRIINGEIPCYKIAEDENYFAFLDINPLSEGHTLVVPKREEDYIFDLRDEELAGLITFEKKVATSQKANLDCKRVAMVVLGMEVPHTHIHLIPMNSEADVDFRKPKLQLSSEQFAQIAERIKL